MMISNTHAIKKQAKFKEKGRLAKFFKIFVADKSTIIGTIIVIALGIMAIFSPWISPFDPNTQNLSKKLALPGTEYYFGTDKYGRDILSRIIWGSRISLLVGIIAIGISVISGALLGLISGYFGGTVDKIIMRFVDVLLGFPMILLALVVVAILGSGVLNLMIAVGISNAPRFARLIRAEALKVKKMDYVTAARALGGSHRRIILNHILPNSLSSTIVLATLRIASAITTEASLSFLGLGITPPTATWGSMIADGRMFLRINPWCAIFPGIMIMLAVMGFNLIGDGIRDLFDPRLRGSRER